MADIDQISTVLGKLQSNYSELARTFYTLFYDETPQDITLEWYDENGDLQTQTIPNRAKDMKYVMNGQVNPEGYVQANPSTIFQNTANGEVFVKTSGTGTSGWLKIISEATLAEYIVKGSGAPNGNITAKLGTLYIDNSTGILYIKVTATSSIGWQPLIDIVGANFVHFEDLGQTVIIDI